eukprot:TRINITY_DN6515_c0_g2_i1.p1 TRINITY_DN6515_c0_g2~~TRINITY_DN6515_c0_g2_i1.p1  ORF type:complete len:724 (-),score=186.47 TRINITY_DN6515_c0_g2_i1:54-2225(-)
MDDDYNNDADGETFFDLDQSTFGGGGDDDELNDEETFGDIGPLNDDWQFSHDKFARIVETERTMPLVDETKSKSVRPMQLEEEPPIVGRRESFTRPNELHNVPPPQQVPASPAKAIPSVEPGFFWSSPAPVSSPNSGSIWGSPSQRPNNDFLHAKPSLVPTEPPKQAFSPIVIKNTPEAEQSIDPIAKLFSSIQTSGAVAPEQPPAFPGGGSIPGNILSAEELEARLRKSVQSNIPPSANQLPPPNFNAWHANAPNAPHVAPAAPVHTSMPAANVPSSAAGIIPTAILQNESRMHNVNAPQHHHQQPPYTGAQQPQQQPYPHFLHHSYPGRRWKESKKMMTADEIDSIIRLQYAQIQTDNPYVEDYYYQTAIQKSLRAQGNVHATSNHKPICESTPRPSRRPTDQPPGVLGRIPSHSVRAPRPLLQVKGANGVPLKPEENQAEQDQEKALSYAIILTVEDAFNCVLDAEDIDQLMNSPAARENRTYLSHLFSKRVAITEELFKLLNIYVPKPGAGAEDHLLQDNILLKMLLITKGRKLLTRVIPLLFAEQFHFLFLFFMRNLSLLLQILSPQTADADDEKATNHFFDQMIAKIGVLKLPNLTYALDTLVFYHTTLLLELLQVEKALALLSTVLQRAYTMVTAQLRTELDNMYIMQWNGVFNLFLHQVLEILPVFALTQNLHDNRSFAKFANVLYASADESQKPKLLQLLSSWSQPQQTALKSF